MSNPIKLAFPLLGRGGWTGGFIYLKNTLALINARLANEIEAHVFLSPSEFEKFGAELSPLVNGRIITDPAIAVAGRGGSLVRSLITGRDAALFNLLKKSGIDVVFENASFYGARFGLPIVSWMPDFQHRHMPEMFGKLNWWRRDLGFRAQIKSGRTVMLSSFSAKHDLEQYYPRVRGGVHVVRFAIDMKMADYVGREEEMRKIYDLPARFFFLPNQFWQHKNHVTVIAALELLKQQDRLQDMPPIILTGQPKDPRNPGHFDHLMSRVKASGVESHFRYLGLVPYDHVLALNASSERMINPSQFEGWSTPIEEAKAFATPLMLSDILIHREQAPDALFFQPLSVQSAADALLTAAAKPPPPRPDLATRIAKQDARLNEHASSLLATVKGALAQARA
jgi:glycosyltransferase involved in cell wall biosynthesis